METLDQDIVQDCYKINPFGFDNETEAVLKALEETRCEFWNLDRASANFLNMLIKINNSKNVLEIGTSNGYSGIWILKALKETSGSYTTIEFWEKRQSVARKNFSKLVPEVPTNPKIGSAIIVLQDLLTDIEKNKIDKFDFVFIDANKKEYIDYFSYVDKMLKPNGLIVADNILSHYNKVENYVKHLYSLNNYQSQIVSIGTGMMLSRKTF